MHAGGQEGGWPNLASLFTLEVRGWTRMGNLFIQKKNKIEEMFTVMTNGIRVGDRVRLHVWNVPILVATTEVLVSLF